MINILKKYWVYLLLAFTPLGIYFIPGFRDSDFFSNDLLNFLKYLPYIIFAGIGLLGLKLNQTRILFSCLIYLLAYHSLQDSNFLMALGIGKIRSRQLFSLSLPLSFLFLFSYKEYPFLNWRSMIRFLFGLSPFLLLGALFVFEPSFFVEIVNFQFFKARNFTVPQLSISFVILFWCSQFLFNDKKINLFRNILIIGLIPFYTATYVGLKKGISFEQLMPNNIICFSSISILLIHAIYKMYWQRVYIDELTNIKNRRAWDEAISALTGQYSIAIMDIDKFKHFNDTYGHAEGDNVLRVVADTLSSVLGSNIFRYGGEEFCAIFDELSSKEAELTANIARQKLESKDFFIRSTEGEPKKVKITISIGLASPDQENKTPEQVTKKADDALYKAKDAGRNCVKIAS